MKHVLSVSLGSSKRDHRVEDTFLGEEVVIERKGTNGDINEMQRLIQAFDGKVDAFGLGGMDLYLVIGNRRYLLSDAQKVVQYCRETPIVDGSGLKNSLEKLVLNRLYNEYKLIDARDKILLVSALDRFGMAETIHEYGNEVIYGDVMFSLGLGVPISSLKTLGFVANLALPIVRRLPFRYLYPTGNVTDDENSSSAKFQKYYYWADVICGDFHYINKYLPRNLENKIIITNTVTEYDEEILKNRGVRYLITTTPSLNGRSFGTNVMEALLISLMEERRELTSETYQSLLSQLEFTPAIKSLN